MDRQQVIKIESNNKDNLIDENNQLKVLPFVNPPKNKILTQEQNEKLYRNALYQSMIRIKNK